MKKEGKKWAKGKYPSTSAGSMRRLLTTGVTVPFPVSTISNSPQDDGVPRSKSRILYGFDLIRSTASHLFMSYQIQTGCDRIKVSVETEDETGAEESEPENTVEHLGTEYLGD